MPVAAPRGSSRRTLIAVALASVVVGGCFSTDAAELPDPPATSAAPFFVDPATLPKLLALDTESLPPGWSAVLRSVQIPPRAEELGPEASYEITTSNGGVAELDVLSGQVSLQGDEITLRRGSREFDAAIMLFEEAEVMPYLLTWNEVPGANVGWGMAMRGDDPETLREVAEAIEFDLQPVAGVSDVTSVDLGPDAITMFVGELGGEWAVLAAREADVVRLGVMIDGVVPTTMPIRDRWEGALHTLVVSKDGRQVVVVVGPRGLRSIEVGGPSGARQPMPTKPLPGTDLEIGAFPLPPASGASVVVVDTGRLTETVSLPLVPATGWTSTALSYQLGG